MLSFLLFTFIFIFTEIARDQNVQYIPDIEVMLQDDLYLAEEAIANKRPGFLIDLGPSLGPPPLPLLNPSDPYAGPPLGNENKFKEMYQI